MKLKNKTALVTGAGTGIGLATARRLAAEGADVVAAVFEDNQLAQVKEFDPLVLDVRSETAWSDAAEHLGGTYGGLDILVNNAGIHRRGTGENTTRALWDEVMDTNVWGMLVGCKTCIPLMRRKGAGAIVNRSSVNALTSVANMLEHRAINLVHLTELIA